VYKEAVGETGPDSSRGVLRREGWIGGDVECPVALKSILEKVGKTDARTSLRRGRSGNLPLGSVATWLRERELKTVFKKRGGVSGEGDRREKSLVAGGEIFAERTYELRKLHKTRPVEVKRGNSGNSIGVQRKMGITEGKRPTGTLGAGSERGPWL